MVEGLRVGELSAKSGIGRKALRLYEARRILLPLRRTPAGYRLYPPDALDLLTFVARARRLGPRLAEFRTSFAFARAGSRPVFPVRRSPNRRGLALEGCSRECRGT